MSSTVILDVQFNQDRLESILRVPPSLPVMGTLRLSCPYKPSSRRSLVPQGYLRPDELENGTLVAEDISHVGSACKEDTLLLTRVPSNLRASMKEGLNGSSVRTWGEQARPHLPLWGTRGNRQRAGGSLDVKGARGEDDLWLFGSSPTSTSASARAGSRPSGARE